MNKKIILIRIFIIILILVWMNSVFGFSNQDGISSASLSIRISSKFSNDPDEILHIDQYVRKIAHFSEYGIGGMLFLALFETFDIIDEKKLIFSAFLGMVYASTDEIHQLFIDGRSGQFTDVIIDTMGAFTGAIFGCLIINIVKLIIEKNKKHLVNNE